MSTPRNEEEVKIQRVMPFLLSLGLTRQELKFEQSFELVIGTNRVKVNSKKRTDAVGGRLDTLVTRNSLPLLIVELKEEGHALTDDDRDQAISYARLVHPIAPYALVTNGKDSQLFEVVGKTPVKSGDFKVRDGYSLELDPTARNEAIALFLGYSSANLLTFCEAQVTEHLIPLKGSVDDLTRKYIPHLTVPSTALAAELAKFEAGDKNGFLLVADSGAGKTTALCDYVEQRIAAKKPTLFYAGSALAGEVLTALVDEFNWTFTEQITPQVLLRRVAALTKGAKFVVVIDAIDEWQHAARGQSLLDLLRGSRDLGIKFVFSCKTSAWEGISRRFGPDIGFERFLHSTGKDALAGYSLPPMTGLEFHRALERYDKVHGIRPRMEKAVLEEARENPFLLRVMYATAKETGTDKLTFTSLEFFRTYLDHMLVRTGDRVLAEKQIISVARSLAARNSFAVSEEIVSSDIGITKADSLFEGLFEHNILERSQGGISFYFGQLRNYLIAFRVLNFERMKPAQLTAQPRDGVIGEALTFYLHHATDQQWRAIAGEIFTNVERYLERYVEAVPRNFPALQDQFAPGFSGDIGFLAEYRVGAGVLGTYGFRTRNQNEPSVILVPVQGPSRDAESLQARGGKGLHWARSTDGFKTLNPGEEIVENELIRQLTHLLESSRLNIRGCPRLITESFVAALHAEEAVFPGLLSGSPPWPNFPVSALQIQQSILRGKLRWHFEEELIEAKIRDGRIVVAWRDDGHSNYSRIITPEESAEIDEAVESSLTSGTHPKLTSILTNATNTERRLRPSGLLGEDCTLVIPGLYGPTEYQLSQLLRSDWKAGMKEIEGYLKQFFADFLTEYRTVVSTNFPTITGGFELFSQMPVRIYLLAVPRVRERAHEVSCGLSEIIEKLPDGAENEVVVLAHDELVFGPEFPHSITIKGRRIDPLLQTGRDSITDLLCRFYQSTPLHDFIYRQICEEWPAAMAELRRVEGLKTLPGKRAKPRLRPH